jgi:hypothetical protein
VGKPLHSGLVAPNTDQLRALAQLKGSGLWPGLKTWLEDSLKSLGANRYAEEYAARWSQGQGQLLDALVEQIESSDSPKPVKEKPVLLD